MAVLTKSEIAALSPQERLALIDELWDSFDKAVAEESAESAPLPEWQRAILDERLAEMEAHPEDGVTLTEARNQSLL